MRTLFQNRAYQISKILTLVLILGAVFFAPEAFTQTYNLKIKLVDELGAPLTSATPPTLSVENCSATAPQIAATRSLGEGIYELAIVVDGSDKNCDLRVTANQYLWSTVLPSSDLSSYQDRTNFPITLYYRTRITVKDELGNPVTDAVVHHAGFSPTRASGGIYYFTTSGSGALLIERTGYITESGSANTQLQNLEGGTSSSATIVESSGTALCANGNLVTAGTSITCARLSPSFTVTVKNPNNESLNDSTVRVFTDIARSTVANDLSTGGSADAQKTTDAFGNVSFALTATRYYVRVERLSYNDVNLVVDITNSVTKTETVIMPNAGVNIVSPGRSQAVVSPVSLPADKVSQALLTVNIYDGTGAALGRRNITVTSTRGEDTVTPSSALTNTQGTVQLAITSSKSGYSVYSVYSDETLLSTFPSVNFTVSAADLNSTVPSPSESKVEASVSPVASNGAAQVTVTIKNAGGVVLANKSVTLTSTRSADDTITPATGITNAEGKAIFNIKSSKSGTSVISITSEGVNLNEMAVITFSPAGKFSQGDLLKSSDNPAVYYYGADGKRHAFPNERVYKSWYADFSEVVTVSSADLASITLGSNITYRPGVKMIKLQTVPKVYAVARGGVLRWVQTEEVARSLYGADWNKKIDDVSDALFTDYEEGAPIATASDFNPDAEKASETKPSN